MYAMYDEAHICAQFGLFHGDPHPGNIFALRDGRIAYVDFGNVAELSQSNKQTLIDAVVHAVNEDYYEMACDFIKLVRRTLWLVLCGRRLCLYTEEPTLHVVAFTSVQAQRL